MPRATTKIDLIKSANEQFEKLWKIIDGLGEDEQRAFFCFDAEKMGSEAHWDRDKNLRDVLVHLYEWHRLLLDFVEANLDGKAKPFLPAPYNWKTYGQMNVEFWEKHQSTSYEDSIDLIRQSHNKVMELIEKFTNEELFTKKHFAWTGSSALGSYCVSATASHYDWATKKLKVQILAMKADKSRVCCKVDC